MIHGKTKIELYNPNTKIKQIIREENTFQSSVLADYLRGLGLSDNNPYANQTFRNSPAWQNLVGGILLFKNSIDTSGGAVKYMPSGNQMIGNGSYNVSNGSSETDPTEMGSWNASESSASASAITQVYDWATNQGNGTIGCICLTSKTGGYIGYGNSSGKAKSLLAYNTNQSWVTNSDTGFVIGNYAYRFSFASGYITVTKKRVCVSQGSVFDGLDISSTTFDLSVVGNHSSFGTSAFFSVDGANIYLVKRAGFYSVESGAKGYFYKYDTTNNTLTEVEFTNTLNYTVYFSGSSSGTPTDTSGICNGMLFIRSVNNNHNYCEVFKLSDGSLVATLDVDANQNGFKCYPITEDLVHIGNYNGTFDCTTHEYRKSNGIINIPYCSVQDAFINLDNSNAFMYKNPLYLATINNLQSPVTKTAAQTMKVTYTLTEA